MNVIYRLFIVFSCITLSLNASSQEEVDLEVACEQYSISLIRTLRLEVIPELTQDRIEAALEVSNRNCLKHFSAAAAENPELAKIENENAIEQKEEKEGFLSGLLKNKESENDGHKRLKRKQ